ncbi:MAG TPA: arginine--tRNA ligase [Candidatus Sulfotelmatobacter sp.]|nr:arginine--tRNA ligase [Candidatus Sulfotelmatobacter sp.]
MEKPAEKIYSILADLAKQMDAAGIEFRVERPKDSSHGDFSSNIALALSKKLNKNPLDLASEIAKKIKEQEFEKVEAVKPGFINFYFSKKYLQNQVQSIIEKGSSYGSSDLGKGKKASVEFVSANPTGPLHIGNARGGPLGDAIANVLAKVGYKVVREYLHNDVGGQVERLGEAIYFTLHPDQKGKDYEMQYQGAYVKELAEQIEEELQDKDMDLSEEKFAEEAGKIAVSLMLSEVLKDCEDMGIKFDKVTKESDLRREVPQALEKIKKSLKEKEGALWFTPNDEFLKDRETVVKKSDGNYTYFASDIAYHLQKMSQNDIVVDILGANHSGHEPRVRAVVKALGFDPDNLKVILYQWIRLKRGSEIVKMSKRAGTFVTAREVLDEVGKDAFRFFLLMQNSSTHMDFDLELAKKKASDNPVFYVQYACTRIASIFEKANVKNFNGADFSLLVEKEETDLIRKLTQFPDLVLDVSKSFYINLLANYALDLASLFHKLYEKHQVVSKDENLTNSRLALLYATQITLKNTLDLLGVSAPEKM